MAQPRHSALGFDWNQAEQYPFALLALLYIIINDKEYTIYVPQ